MRASRANVSSISSYLLSHLTSSPLISSHLILSLPIALHLIPSHLISPHLISSLCTGHGLPSFDAPPQVLEGDKEEEEEKEEETETNDEEEEEEEEETTDSKTKKTKAATRQGDGIVAARRGGGTMVGGNLEEGKEEEDNKEDKELKRFHDMYIYRAFNLLPSKDPLPARSFTAEAVCALSSTRGRAKVPYGRCVDRWRANFLRNG